MLAPLGADVALTGMADTMSATFLGRRVADWALHTEASTRTSALIRMGLAVLLWARWAGDVAPWHARFDDSWPWTAISLSFYLSTSLLFAGLFSRCSAAWAGVTALAIYLFAGRLVGPGPWVHHHTYLLSAATLLCALTPCGRSYSVDRWLAVRRAARDGTLPPAERGNLWGLRLIALQVSSVYLWSAYSKMTPAFLSGERLEHILMWHFAGSDPVLWAGWQPMLVSTAWGTVALSIVLGVGPFFPRVRIPVLTLGALLHAAYYVAVPVATFSATMWVLYLAYFDADAVHGVIDRMEGKGAGPV